MISVERKERVICRNALKDSVRALHGSRALQEPWGFPWIHPTAGPGSEDPTHHLHQKQGRQKALGQPHSWVSLGPGQAGMQACRWSWLWRYKAQQVRAMRTWRPALLIHHWDRGWQPWGLMQTPELWAGWVAPGWWIQTGKADSVSGTQQTQHAESWTSARPVCPPGQARYSLKDGVVPESGEPLSFSPTFQQYQSHCHLCPVSSMLVPTAYTLFCPFRAGFIHPNLQTSLLQLCTDSAHPFPNVNHLSSRSVRDIKPVSPYRETASEISSFILFLLHAVLQ